MDHHVPAHCFEAHTIRLHNGDGQVARLAHLQVACYSGLSLMRTGNYEAMVTIFQLRGLCGGHGDGDGAT